MKLSAFRLRILGGALLTAALAVALVWGTTSLVLFALLSRARPELPAVLGEACARDPVGWSTLKMGPLELTAYDERGVPAVPDAAAIPLEGWQGLEVGGSLSEDQGGRRVVVNRMAERGPCAYLVERSGPPPELLNGMRVGLGAGAFLAMLGVAGLSYGVTVTPLLRRIERLRGAAVQVGGSSYASADDRVGDALADIGAALDRSHDRIEADRRELVARHEALERYLAEIAHDLRTPLGSLLLAVQELLAETPSAPAGRALSDVAYLTALVENLHQAARLRHGLDAREGVADLREVVLRSEIRFRALGQASGVEVAAAVPEAPVMVRCSPVLAERVVANLLQNAMSHGARHVAVRLSAGPSSFQLVVLDDGPGVARPADLALRTFERSPARPRSAGLGLAITNEIARRAGWTVSYANEGGLRVLLSGSLAEEEGA
jgi:signal transduction histidine kinase